MNDTDLMFQFDEDFPRESETSTDEVSNESSEFDQASTLKVSEEIEEKQLKTLFFKGQLGDPSRRKKVVLQAKLLEREEESMDATKEEPVVLRSTFFKSKKNIVPLDNYTSKPVPVKNNRPMNIGGYDGIESIKSSYCGNGMFPMDLNDSQSKKGNTVVSSGPLFSQNSQRKFRY